MPEEDKVCILFEELDDNNINSLLIHYQLASDARKQISDWTDKIKKKVSIYLKERKWDRYVDKETNISATISKYERKKIDEEQLKTILTEQQMIQVQQVMVIEKLSIVTPRMRESMKNVINKEKIGGR